MFCRFSFILTDTPPPLGRGGWGPTFVSSLAQMFHRIKSADR